MARMESAGSGCRSGRRKDGKIRGLRILTAVVLLGASYGMAAGAQLQTPGSQADTPGPAGTPEPLQVMPPGQAETRPAQETYSSPQPSVVYSAAFTEIPESELGGSVTVITAKELEERKIRTVAEALNHVPGVDVVASGGPGQPTFAYIRGAASRYTLVLLNGLELNDPIAPGQVADLAHLTVDNVERIEIVRGPQSAVYGSGGLAGVINIITRKPAARWNGSAGLEGGKYGTWTGKAAGSGSLGPWGLAVAASSTQTQGFSAAKRELSYPQPLPDMLPNASRNFTGDAGLGLQASSDLAFRLQTRWSQGRLQVDNGPGDSGDASDYWTDYSQVQARLEADWKVWPESWQQQASVGLSQGDRSSANDLGGTTGVISSRYQARHIAVDWKNRFRDMVIGAAYSQDQGTYHDDNNAFWFMETDFTEHSEHLLGFFFEDRFHWEGLTLDAGIRWDVHDQYGSQTNYRLTPVYLVKPTNTRLKANYGTGFKAPSLDQLYSDYGNPALRPEISRGWEAGLEQNFDQARASLGVTYFQTDIENQISSDPLDNYRYRNLGRVQTKGWEAFAAWTAAAFLNLKLSYTKLTANDLTLEDTDGPQTLARAADYQLKLSADYRLAAFHGSVQAARIGPRYESWPRQLLEPYTLVDLTAAWDVLPEVQVYAKINNLLDADYVEVVGYNTARFAAYGGVEIKWP